MFIIKTLYSTVKTNWLYCTRGFKMIYQKNKNHINDINYLGNIQVRNNTILKNTGCPQTIIPPRLKLFNCALVYVKHTWKQLTNCDF